MESYVFIAHKEETNNEISVFQMLANIATWVQVYVHAMLATPITKLPIHVTVAEQTKPGTRMWANVNVAMVTLDLYLANSANTYAQIV